MAINSTTVPLTTDFDLIDRAIRNLHDHRSTWVQTSIPQRLAYLQACLDRTLTVAEAWTIAACQAKGIDPQSSLAGEEWVAGPISIIRNIRLLINSLQADGQLTPPKTWQRSDGQFVAEVLPANAIERLLYLGYRGEVWLEP
jgi:acyl-CoA reductase-like NAD-dependent aldehyde dehydrogenase